MKQLFVQFSIFNRCIDVFVRVALEQSIAPCLAERLTVAGTKGTQKVAQRSDHVSVCAPRGFRSRGGAAGVAHQVLARYSNSFAATCQ